VTAHDDEDRRLREIRRRLVNGEITPEEAAEQGFPPADPIEERR
jgi:hypothetical protein